MSETFPPSVQLKLGGARVDLMTHDGVMRALRRQLTAPSRTPLCLASANLDHLGHFGAAARPPRDLDDGSGRCRWLVLLDGKPLQWAANRLTNRSWDLLAGSDLLPELLAIAAECGARLGVLGGQEETHEALARRLSRDYPGVAVAGMWAPSRQELERDRGELARAVRAAGVDLLVVALGKPRQEEWLRDNAQASGIKAGLAFGAAADFLAGTARRAPNWSRSLGLEWAYRLLREPRRLSHRYLVRGPVEALALLTESGHVSASDALHVLIPAQRSAHDEPSLRPRPAPVPGRASAVATVDLLPAVGGER